MHRVPLKLLNVSKTFAAGLFFIAIMIASLPFGFAGDKEDKAAVSALIAIIESSKAGQADQAGKLFESIPANSTVKPVAAYSLALVQIRDQQFSQAWKVLTSPSNNEGAAPDSIKLGKERIKLWLLLEANSAEKAEPQLERLVTMSLVADAANGDQTASCSLIGSIVGMLKTDGGNACIKTPALEKAKQLLLTKVESKNAKTKLEEQLAEASKWGAELSELVGKFESMGIDKADELNLSTQAEFERSKQEDLQLRGDLKSAGGEKRVLEDQRKKLIQNRNHVQEDFKKEERSKPAFPVNPGPPPRHPREPSGSYKTDPKTQERKYVPPSDREKREYQEELKLSKTYSESVAKFQRDSLEYPAKIQLWETRLAALGAQTRAAELKIASTEKTLKDMQEEIKQGIGKDLKQTSDQLEQLERLAAISNIAYKHVASNDPKTKILVRPSNFQLLDYESECIILRKSLR